MTGQDALEAVRGSRVRFDKKGKTLKLVQRRWLEVESGALRHFSRASGGKSDGVYLVNGDTEVVSLEPSLMPDYEEFGVRISGLRDEDGSERR